MRRLSFLVVLGGLLGLAAVAPARAQSVRGMQLLLGSPAAESKAFVLRAVADPVVVPTAAPNPATACGSSPHCIVYQWGAPADVASGSTYNLYTLAGTQAQPCPATAPTSVPGGFTKANSAAIAATTFTLPESAPGAVCAFVTQVQNGVESLPSNDVPAVILPLAPAMQAPTAF